MNKFITACLLAVNLTAVAQTPSKVPTLSDKQLKNFFKAQNTLTGAQSAFQSAQSSFQAVVQDLIKTCGSDAELKLDAQSQEPTCSVKAKAPVKPAEPIKTDK